jgi:hypothetical protein
MAKASTQTTLYKDPYVEWCYENDKTLINGAKIHTGSLFSKYIEATDLHISGDSSFEGNVICKDQITLKYGTETINMTAGLKSISNWRYSWTGSAITNVGSAVAVPAFVLDSKYGMYLNGTLNSNTIISSNLSTANASITTGYVKTLYANDLTVKNTISGTVNNALKLGGRSLTADGNRWGSVPFVGDDGVMEVGRYIDFHLSDADSGTSGDTTGGRLEADGTNLKFKDKKLATIEESHTAARTGLIKIGDMAIAFGSASAKSGTSAGDGLYTGNATANFGVTFKFAPVISVSFSGRQNDMRVVGTSSVTTTSADVWFKGSAASTQRSIQWIAIGQLA